MDDRRRHLQLLAFTFGPALDIIHVYFENKVLHNTNLNLFLNDHLKKHQLFHEYKPRIPCCKGSSCSIAKPNKEGCLDKRQFCCLFESNSSIQPNHEIKNGKVITQHCLCQYSAKISVTVDDLDITLISALIQTCCIPGTIPGNLRWLTDIREVRNDVVHNGKGEINNTEFANLWTKLETAALEFASLIAGPIKKLYKKQIDEIKTKSNEDLLKVINDSSEKTVESIILSNNGISTSFVALHENIKTTIQNNADNMTNILEKTTTLLNESQELSRAEIVKEVHNTHSNMMKTIASETSHLKGHITDEQKSVKQMVQKAIATSTFKVKKEIQRGKEHFFNEAAKTGKRNNNLIKGFSRQLGMLTEEVRQLKAQIAINEFAKGTNNDLQNGQLKETETHRIKVEAEIDSVIIDEDKTLQRLPYVQKDFPKEQLHIESSENKCILLKMSADPHIFKDENSLRSAIRSLIEKVIEAAEIDVSIDNTIDVSLTFTSPLTTDQRETVFSLLSKCGVLNDNENSVERLQQDASELQSSISPKPLEDLPEIYDSISYSKSEPVELVQITVNNIEFEVQVKGFPKENENEKIIYNSESETLYVHWTLDCQKDWNLRSIKETMKNMVTKYAGCFRVDVFQIDMFDRLSLDTATQRNVVNSFLCMELEIKTFLEHIVESCQIKSETPSYVSVIVTILPGADKNADLQADLKNTDTTNKEDAKGSETEGSEFETEEDIFKEPLYKKKKSFEDTITTEYFTKNLKRNVKCIEGDNVNLSCEVLDADAVSEWSKNGVILQKCVKYEMQMCGKIHTLSIVGAELQDAGVYSVKINNRWQSTSLKVKEHFPKNLERNVEIIDCDKVNISCEDQDVDATAEWAPDDAVLHKCEYFTKPLGSRTCIEGESVQFECEVLNDNQATLWFKDGTQLSTSDKYNVQRHGRLHRLVVNSTQLDDQGKYLVKIKNCFLTSTLIVQEYFTKPLVTMTCIEGDCVQLECEVLHVNQKALWFKNSTEVRTSNKYKVEQLGKLHRLIVNNTRLDDQGEYSVKIKNCVRRSHLVVQVYFTKPLVAVTCIEGDSVQFECEVPQINQTAMWFKDDTDVRTADKYKVERHGGIHRLVVNNTKLDDQGEYSVKIKNCVRRSELIVQEYFTTPLGSMTSCLEGENVQFECEVRQINQTAVWLKDGTEVRTSEKYKVERHGRIHKLVVNNTHLDDQGEYCVKIKDCVRRTQLIVEEIPASFRHLSAEDKGLYLDIIKSKTETRYYIRIVIVGENGVGKTCLLRRLLGEPIADVTSTDGIDIVRRCKIRLSDGQWIIDKGSNTRKELVTRMRRALNANSYDDENIEQKTNSQSSISETFQTNQHQSYTSKVEQLTHFKRKSMVEKMEGIEPSIRNTNDKQQRSHEGLSLPKYELRKSISETHEIELEITKEKIEPILDKILTENILDELSKFINEVNKSEIPNEILVDCGFWDFAGQRHYYPTHPIFLNRNSVHLLVADILKDIKQINTEDDYDKIGEYIDFWFDSIHSCEAVEPIMDSTENYLNPPVIVVCTGIDKCRDKLDIRKNEFRKQLLSMLQNEDKLKHLRRICCISNTEPSDTDLDYLRHSIFEFGKNIETFGEKLPLRWIQLEQTLEIVSEAGINILSWPDIADLASKCLINDEKEVSLFLKYHHKVGTIIYFESLKEYIILNQQWLADAFRCLVSDKYENDLKITQEWKTLEDTGELKLSLIAKLFQKQPEREFNKHEGHLLKLMEMFGIIIKLKTLSEDGKILRLPTYYMPCMISHKTSISQLYDVFKVEKDNCTPWLCIDFDFMPFDFFNHIFCHYVRKYQVCSEARSKRIAIYHGIGVFYLDKLRKFVVCFSKNTIALQIWQWKQLQHGKCREKLEELKSVINNVKNKYEPRRVSYTVKAKCCNGNIHIVAGRLRYAELLDAKDEGYVCEEHNVIHDTRDFLQTWFEDYSVNDEYVPPQKKFKENLAQRFHQKCHICNKELSVYWCYDCQRSMCNDCNNQHRESDQTEHHIVQHVQDEYALDYKVVLNVEIIIDLKMLKDGLLVVGNWGGKQLVTLHKTRQAKPDFILLPGDPYRIALVDNNTVAVTLPKEGALVIVDVRKKEIKKRINVKVGTGGIIHRDNQLFICHSKTIKTINMSGEVTNTIPLAIIPKYIYDNGDGLIYCTDENKLHCLNEDGKIVATLANPDLSAPVGISIDDDGQLLVTSDNSSNVLRISPDGTRSKVIIKQIASSDWFEYIWYDSMSKSIVIGTDKTVYYYTKL